MDGGERGRHSPLRQSASQQSTFGAPTYNTSIHYQGDYPHDNNSRQQNFGQYNSNVMYNIPQTPNQYGTNQSYAPRQIPEVEVLSNQFPGNPQFFPSGDPPLSVASETTNQRNVSQFSSPYSQYSPAPGRVQPPHVANLSALSAHNLNQAASDGGYTQPAAVSDEAYTQYQSALKQTFQNTKDGRLGEAGASLLEISEWLLSNAVELAIGLVRDEQELHEDRLKLWNEFNTCWLSVLRKEKEMLQDFRATGQSPVPPQEFLREDFLEKMGHELTRLCDNMEGHGLVDYQMGVWEEEIIDAIQDCLSLLEQINLDLPPSALEGARPR